MGADEKKTAEELEAERDNKQKRDVPQRRSKTKKPDLDSALDAAVQKIEPSKESTLAISNMTYKKEAPAAIECLVL